MKRINKENKKDDSNANNYRRWLKSGWLTFFGFLILLIIIWPLFERISREKTLTRDIEIAKQEITKYEGDNQKLQELIDYLGSDQAVEDKAKLNLGMKKVGEKVVVIQTPTPPISDQVQEEGGLKNNFSRWYKYFFR